VAGALGCSVHWFMEHATFRNGGLVAISEYEDGVRFLQIKSDGSIEEQGYFLSLGSSAPSPTVAAPEDEGGVRLLKIKWDGSIEEQGYFLSLGSPSSSPKWAGKDDVVYSLDY